MIQEELQLTKVAPAEILPADEFHRARGAKWAEFDKIVVYGKTVTVTDDASRDRAVEVGRLLQTAAKELKEFYAPIKRAFDVAKQPVLDAEKTDLKALDELKGALASQVQKYQAEQERVRQERERQERAAAQKAEEERRLAEAIELEALGLADEAAARLDEPPAPVAVIVAGGATKVSGFVTKTMYRAQVDDFPALVRAVAAGAVAVQVLSPNQAWLDSEANKYQEGFSMPGVSAHKVVSSHFRS